MLSFSLVNRSLIKPIRLSRITLLSSLHPRKCTARPLFKHRLNRFYATDSENTISKPDLSLVKSSDMDQRFRDLEGSHFDTYSFFKTLVEGGYNEKEAEAFLDVTNMFITELLRHSHMTYLSEADFENFSYLFRTALSELRSEKINMRKDQISTLRAGLFSNQREVEGLEQLVHEHLNKLGTESKMEFENRKNDTRNDVQQLSAKIVELHNLLSVSLGKLRAENEKQKWEQIRKAAVVVMSFTGFLVLVIPLGLRFRSKKKERAYNVEELNEYGQDRKRDDYPDSTISHL
ncbi:mitochondrial proline metabolism regulator [Schizosaccharomyces osmophilus]|uniref:Mitochondrial proline metabolism regulator n=1 Tax=Schizosaccharomyces osmophilus TaxID=2545709 RepID=A0AAE9W9P7_9SCHI|nr:mitochondrial proline metabolism regulator [Schizosaccharomyces osmophilus]WBW72307.1 mitochondrial proline metabolism regulator [Schizosaccharomyces osmophilus]